MEFIIPRLDTEKVLVKDSPKAKGGHVFAWTKSRSHKLLEGQKFNAITAAVSLTDVERQAIADGADLYISQVTYGDPSHDLLVHVGRDAAAKFFDVGKLSPEEMLAGVETAQHEYAVACESVVTIAHQLKVAHATDQNASEIRTLELRRNHAQLAVGKAWLALGQARINAGDIDGL